MSILARNKMLHKMRNIFLFTFVYLVMFLEKPQFLFSCVFLSSVVLNFIKAFSASSMHMFYSFRKVPAAWVLVLLCLPSTFSLTFFASSSFLLSGCFLALLQSLLFSSESSSLGMLWLTPISPRLHALAPFPVFPALLLRGVCLCYGASWRVVCLCYGASW